jgi:uncharacterized metal-binding protein
LLRGLLVIRDGQRIFAIDGCIKKERTVNLYDSGKPSPEDKLVSQFE